MKKHISISLCVIYNCFLFAQIPYATQQPKWYFPIYAQDATGKKDTIYLGYNPGASDVVGTETQFGEIWQPGGAAFSISTYSWINPVDSVVKVNIRDTTNFGYYLPYNPITISNAVLPVTFKWDVSLLRSDSIPFPVQGFLPRAQLNIEMSSGMFLVGNPNVTCNISMPIIVSDTIDTSVCTCGLKDSLTLLDPFGNTSPQSFYYSFNVVPWTGKQPTGIKDYIKADFKVYPNPAQAKIMVQGLKKNKNYSIRIYNSIFNECIEIPLFVDGDIIDISFLDSGFYFLLLENTNSKERKIITLLKQ